MKKNKNQVTVADLDELVEKIKEKEERIEFLSDILKKFNKELASLEAKGVLILKDLDRENYDSPHGKIKIEQKWRVGLPKDINDKMLFFDYLKDKGVFETYATIMSASLQSFYFAEQKAQPEDLRPIFSMPGIPAPTLFEKFKFARSKKK